MAISQAWISSAVGVFPTPYVGDCAEAALKIPRNAGTRRNLGKPIVNAPVARDRPRLNGIVGPSNPDSFNGFVPVFRHVGPRRLNRAQFVRAARHQRTLFSVPPPVVAESSVRHWIGR